MPDSVLSSQTSAPAGLVCSRVMPSSCSPSPATHQSLVVMIVVKVSMCSPPVMTVHCSAPSARWKSTLGRLLQYTLPSLRGVVLYATPTSPPAQGRTRPGLHPAGTPAAR